MNRRMIARLIAYTLIIEVIAMLPALGISLAHQESDSVRGFLLSIGIILACCALLLLFRPRSKTFYAGEGFVTTALSWIIISLFGALPLWLSGAVANPVDCFFEIVSGFTTTGASVLSDVESLPRGILYWRSFTNWLGGMGVLVFLLAITSTQKKGEGSSLHLLRAESPGPIVGKLMPKLKQTAVILYAIYLVMSLLELIFLLAGGMPLFDSFCTVFATAGTGGVCIKNDSMMSYSPYLQTVVGIFMALFGVNFSIFYLLLTRQFARALFDEEVRAYLAVMAVSVLLITLNILPLYHTFGEALQHSFFQVASIITTTGYVTADYGLWPGFSQTILLLLMAIGACAGSTGGGYKISRLLISFKSVKKEISRMLHPRAVKAVHMNGKTLDNTVTKGVSVYTTVYCAIILLSFLLISLDNQGILTNITAVLSCTNNVGPGMDAVGPSGNYSVFSNFGKIILALDMLLGRLEFFPILILMMPSTWKRKSLH